jgi:uncharacterized protein involved in exopolysaccharide biosynthesis
MSAAAVEWIQSVCAGRLMAIANAPSDRGTADIAPVPLIEVLRFLGRARWALIAGLVIGALLGFAAGQVLTKKYRADAVLMVVSPNEGRLGGLTEQIGGLASLVGVDIGTSTSRGEAIQTLRSQYLARRFIEQENLMPLLFAADWDAGARAWRAKDPAEQPTIAQGVRKFRERVTRVSEDKAAGTLLVSVTWPDREIAAKWTNGLVALANQELRSRAIRDSQSSIDFLADELKRTETVEIRAVMYKLMESHLRTMVVAKTRADFALRTLDPAVPPDVRAYVTPRRVLLILIGAVVGTLLALLLYGLLLLRRSTVASRPGES